MPTPPAPAGQRHAVAEALQEHRQALRGLLEQWSSQQERLVQKYLGGGCENEAQTPYNLRALSFAAHFGVAGPPPPPEPPVARPKLTQMRAFTRNLCRDPECSTAHPRKSVEFNLEPDAVAPANATPQQLPTVASGSLQSTISDLEAPDAPSPANTAFSVCASGSCVVAHQASVAVTDPTQTATESELGTLMSWGDTMQLPEMAHPRGPVVRFEDDAHDNQQWRKNSCFLDQVCNFDSDIAQHHTKWIVSPLSTAAMAWHTAFFVVLVADLWITSFELAFTNGIRAGWLKIMSLCFLAFFGLDIVLNFFMGVIVDGHVVLRRQAAVAHYLKLWFWIDLASTAPALVAVLVDTELGRQFSLLRASRGVRAVNFVKALRLLRAARLVQHDTSFSIVGNFVMNHFDLGHAMRRCGRFLYVQLCLALLVHLHATAWAGLQEPSWHAETEAQAYRNYQEALWWAYSFFASGAPWTSAPSTAVLLLEIFLNAERVLGFMWVVDTVVHEALARRDEEGDAASVQATAVAYLKRHRIPVEAQLKVHQCLKQSLKIKNQHSVFQNLIREYLPHQLRQSLCDELWTRRLLSNGVIVILSSWQEDFVHQLCLFVRETFRSSHTVLFTTGDASNSCFQLLRGRIGITHSDRKASMADYVPGHWISEMALINPDLPRGETTVCREFSSLMEVDAQQFRDLLERLDLQNRLSKMLRQQLWLGFCGRCGMLGDHFSKACPLLRADGVDGQLRWRPVFMPTVPGLGRGMSAKIARHLQKTQSTDLHRFLVKQNIGHLEGRLLQRGVSRLHHLDRECLEKLKRDPEFQLTGPEWNKLSQDAVEHFRKRIDGFADRIMGKENSAVGHLAFLSHYKKEAGTEAALMADELENLIREDPTNLGHHMEVPIFLDSENLQDLGQLQAHVRQSHNLVLLLTKDILTRPWCLLEIVTAVRANVRIVPCDIQRRDAHFQFPDEDYYASVADGSAFDESCLSLLEEYGVTGDELASCIRKVFQRIAVPFSPHRSKNIRTTELVNLLKHCQHRPVEELQTAPTNVSALTAASSFGV